MILKVHPALGSNVGTCRTEVMVIFVRLIYIMYEIAQAVASLGIDYHNRNIVRLHEGRSVLHNADTLIVLISKVWITYLQLDRRIHL